MPVVRTAVLLAATLTTGLIAGFFYAYACSVTIGLGLLPDAQYVAAMRAINASVRNALFAFGFFGAGVCLLGALAVHAARPRSPRFALVALAAVLYIGGGLLLTGAVNVPLNDALAGAGTSPSSLAAARAAYEGPWNYWNGVRALCSGLAFLALIAACLAPSGPAATRNRV